MVKIPPSNGEGLIPGQGLGSHMRHSESKKKKKKDAKELMKMMLGKNEGSYSLNNTITYLLCNKQWYLYCG